MLLFIIFEHTTAACCCLHTSQCTAVSHRASGMALGVLFKMFHFIVSISGLSRLPLCIWTLSCWSVVVAPPQITISWFDLYSWFSASLISDWLINFRWNSQNIHHHKAVFLFKLLSSRRHLKMDRLTVSKETVQSLTWGSGGICLHTVFRGIAVKLCCVLTD